jgi:hypothetical protein
MRDHGVRRSRRIRSGVVAAGVAGSIGLAGLAAVTTISAGQSGAQPQSGGLSIWQIAQPQGGDDSGEESDDGGGGQALSQQQQFQQPQLPQPGTNQAPLAQSSGS